MGLRAHMRLLRSCTSGYASSCCRGQRETARGTLANTARPLRSAVEACPHRDQLDADASRYECAPRSLKRRGRLRLLRSRATNAQTGGCQPLACCGRRTRRQRFIYDFQPTHWGSPDARSLERSPSSHQQLLRARGAQLRRAYKMFRTSSAAATNKLFQQTCVPSGNASPGEAQLRRSSGGALGCPYWCGCRNTWRSAAARDGQHGFVQSRAAGLGHARPKAAHWQRAVCICARVVAWRRKVAPKDAAIAGWTSRRRPVRECVGGRAGPWALVSRRHASRSLLARTSRGRARRGDSTPRGPLTPKYVAQVGSLRLANAMPAQRAQGFGHVGTSISHHTKCDKQVSS